MCTEQRCRVEREREGGEGGGERTDEKIREPLLSLSTEPGQLLGSERRREEISWDLEVTIRGLVKQCVINEILKKSWLTVIHTLHTLQTII